MIYPGVITGTLAEQPVCPEGRPDSSSLVIFGASGDLTHQKLIVALYKLFRRSLMPESFYILGVARSDMNDDSFRDRVKKSLVGRFGENPEELESFLGHCYYVKGGYDDPDTYRDLKERMGGMNGECPVCRNRVYYLAVPPSLYGTIAEQLASAGLNREDEDDPRHVRVVVEKPFGRDLESALDLDGKLRRFFSEDQIYRIDHYLGKETVQNILMFRFGNTVFEPVWNRRYISNVQITVAEKAGIGGRAGYYEEAGQLRDVFQNHMMQMLSMVAMEPPVSFEADRVRDEKVKLLRSIRRFPGEDLDRFLVRGQYGPGVVEGEEVAGYPDEPGVHRDSHRETFVAARMFVDNWRWHDVPFYLRTGKRMGGKASWIVLTFRRVPHSIFTHVSPSGISPNILVFNVQPNEGVSMTILAKSPGSKLCMSSLKMEFTYSSIFGVEIPDAYERLLLDCMRGDQSLFIRSDDMRVAWELFTPILKAWSDKETQVLASPLYRYPAGTWGPESTEDLVCQDGNKWWYPSEMKSGGMK